MLIHNHQRRTLLRGALAAGCVLSVPMLAGCNPKEPTTKPAETSSGSTGLSGSPGGAATGDADQPMATSSKMSKVQAKYQDQPKADQMCVNCANFIAPNRCKVVDGEIGANGWCTLWARKQT